MEYQLGELTKPSEAKGLADDSEQNVSQEGSQTKASGHWSTLATDLLSNLSP